LPIGINELYLGWVLRKLLGKFSFYTSVNLLGSDVGQMFRRNKTLLINGGNYGWNLNFEQLSTNFGSEQPIGLKPRFKPIFNLQS